jgi:hypothetical protein
MKRKYIVIVLFLVAIILFFTPFLFEKDTNENISTGINLITGFSSLLTLLIALFLFNKFGIDTTLLDKRTKEVFGLLENLSNSYILIRGTNEFFRFIPIKPYADYYESYYNRKLLFSTRYVDGLPHIWKYCDNIFLPKEIAEKLKELRVYGIVIREEIDDTFLKVTIPSNAGDPDKFGIANNVEISFLEFIRKWIDLVDEIKKWIEKNSSLKSELNIDEPISSIDSVAEI